MNNERREEGEKHAEGLTTMTQQLLCLLLIISTDSQVQNIHELREQKPPPKQIAEP